MSDDVPTTKPQWRAAARKAGVEYISIRDRSDVPSASSMEEKDYLCLRVIWTTVKLDRLDPAELGITASETKRALNHLTGREEYNAFITYAGRLGETNTPLRDLPYLDYEARRDGIFPKAYHLPNYYGRSDRSSQSPQSNGPKVGRQFRSNRLQKTPGGKFPQPDWHRSADKTPEARSRTQSSGDPSSFQESPLASYGGPPQTRSPRSRSEDRVSQEDFPDSISAQTGVSAGAAKILYPAVRDEMIFNTFLILLLNATAAFYLSATVEWRLIRWILRCELGTAALEARTDGYLRGKDDRTVVLVEVKARARSIRRGAIRMQEATQMVTLIAQEGFPDRDTRRFILLFQDRHEVYLAIPYYDKEYLEYLKGETDARTSLSLLMMRTYGPWSIYSASDLDGLCQKLLALTISASN
ncbi:hypothetical protein AJ79_08689 [Helicocarpus griseus UAMH5409]|uniref:Uncharacterized protein n=1 Tax=Helicocarpus griseus UAMH5409 TaxID=1447875 RepID=A0A2B7WQU4_9EURO|nr:hypothetical protein AJ79_08689 [Helicocarpus griseus UAMH5409]